MADNNKILSAFLAEAGTDYEERIPELTRANIAEVGNAIVDYEPTRNAFTSMLVNKIALTLISTMSATNKFARFKGEQITYGDTIEDIYIDAVKAQNFDGSNTNPFGQKKPDLKVLYHKIDRELQYKVTISDVMLRRAFKNSDGLQRLIDGIVDSLYQSKEWDEFTMFKQTLVDNYDNAGEVVEVTGATPAEQARNLLFELQKRADSLEFVSRDYNKMEVATNTPLNNQVLVLHKDLKPVIDMDVLAGVYNMDKVAYSNTVITVDNFNADENGILAVLVDDRGIRYHDSLFTMETLRNPEGLYTNYYLNAWGLISYAYFRNLIYFVEGTTPDPDNGDGE